MYKLRVYIIIQSVISAKDSYDETHIHVMRIDK